MVRALGFDAGSVYYAPGSVVGLALGFVAAVAIVAIAVFGCAGHKKNSGGKKHRRSHWPAGAAAGVYVGDGGAGAGGGGGGCGGGGGGGGCGGGGGGGGC